MAWHMPIIELEDFEYHAAIASVINDRELSELAFSAMFVFLVNWAAKNDVLGEELKTCSVFAERYPKLLQGNESFSSFVLDVLDGKLTTSSFSDEVVQFIKDYVEYDDYVSDLTAVYSTNIGALPENFEKAEVLYKAINTSRKNYKENKGTSRIWSYSQIRKNSSAKEAHMASRRHEH
jgi:hypothetical protein